MWLPSLSLCRSLRLFSLAFRSFLLITSRVHRALYVRHVAGLTTLLRECVLLELPAVGRRKPVGVGRPLRWPPAAAAAAGLVAVAPLAEASVEGLAVEPGAELAAGPVAELEAGAVAAVTVETAWLPSVTVAAVTELAEPGGPGPMPAGRDRPPARQAARRWRRPPPLPVLLHRRWRRVLASPHRRAEAPRRPLRRGCGLCSRRSACSTWCT